MHRDAVSHIYPTFTLVSCRVDLGALPNMVDPCKVVIPNTSLNMHKCVKGNAIHWLMGCGWPRYV